MEVNKAGYTIRHKSRQLGRGSNAQKSMRKKSGDGPTDTPSYSRLDATRNERTLKFVLLKRKKNLIHESSIIFKNRSIDTREEPSQKEK